MVYPVVLYKSSSRTSRKAHGQTNSNNWLLTEKGGCDKMRFRCCEGNEARKTTRKKLKKCLTRKSDGGKI